LLPKIHNTAKNSERVLKRNGNEGRGGKEGVNYTKKEMDIL